MNVRPADLGFDRTGEVAAASSSIAKPVSSSAPEGSSGLRVPFPSPPLFLHGPMGRGVIEPA